MRIQFQLVAFLFLRTILNTAHRMAYPFLSVFARGLGVDISSMSLLMTARSLVGSFSPFFFAPLADRRGRKFGMTLGVAIFTLAMAIVAIHPTYWTFFFGLLLSILGKYIFDPAMQAYFGDRIPYAERGAALAITEVAWSFAFIFGVPGIGFLIARFGWSAPFPALAAFGALVIFVIWRIVPDKDAHYTLARDSRASYRAVFASVPALAGIAVSMCASAGNELVSLMFGVWLEDSFGLRIAALAGASAVIGISELSGEGLVALTTDRLGKPLALTIGLVGNALASLLLPFIGQTQIGALVGLFLFYITFEYVIVSHISLASELVPSARATMLSLNFTGHSLGRAAGALLAGILYQRFGFLFVALTAALFNLAGLLALRIMQRETPSSSKPQI